MSNKDYDKNGKRITPFRSIHKSIRRRSSRFVDHTGAHRLKVQAGIVSDKTLQERDEFHIEVNDRAGIE